MTICRYIIMGKRQMVKVIFLFAMDMILICSSTLIGDGMVYTITIG